MTGFVFDLLYALPAVFFFGTFINTYIIGEISRPLVYIIMTVGCIFVLLYRHFSMQLRIIFSGITVFILLGAFFAIRGLRPEFFGEYGLFILWEFLTGVGICLVCQILSLNIAGKWIYAGALFSGLFISLFLGLRVNAFCVSSAFLGVAVTLCEMLQLNRSKNVKKYLVFLTPFLLVFFLILSISKAPLKPYDWHNFINAWHRVKEITFELKQKLFYDHDEDYEATMIDFSEEGNFGGNIVEGGHEIMNISSGRNKGESIYLVGTTFDTFEDMEWKHSSIENSNGRFFDSLEGLCTAAAIDSQNSTDYVRTENIDITFLAYSTRHAFAPSKTLDMAMNNQVVSLTVENGDLFFEDTKGYKTNYRVLFLKINGNSSAIEKLTGGEYSFDEKLYDKVAGKYGLRNNPDLSYEKYLEYKESIEGEYLPYTEVSDEIRERLDYIESLTENPYERLCILEKELKKMTYSTQPGNMPDYVKTPEDYLDYFCFKSGKGYCSHFATAFALMARAMGIPSRFVQGYCVPVTDGVSVAETSMAHAWVECYLEGAGWVAFDPSEGHGAATYWVTSDEKNIDVHKIDYYESMFSISSHDNGNLFETEEEPEQKTRIHIKWYVIVIPLLGIILFVSGFFVLELNIFERRINKADSEKKAKLLCRANMNMLSYCGYRLKEGETLEEFGERILLEVSKTGLKFLPVFERILYAQSSVEISDVASVKESFDRIRLILKDEKKILFYWYYLKGIRNT